MMIITSLLDTDLYKLSLQNAVRHHFPQAQVIYRFTNRGRTAFSREMYEKVVEAVNDLGALRLTPDESQWLRKKCPYFNEDYLNYLAEFSFLPKEQIKIEFIVEKVDDSGIESGRIEVEIKGGWAATILYEVPVMAIISEIYFTIDDILWDYQGQFEQARMKGLELSKGGCLVSEFGTRRRRSFKAQEIVIQGLLAAHQEINSEGSTSSGKLSGTSNVLFAKKHDLLPIGTIAHEWIMGIAALHGYQGSNALSMQLWDECYPSKALSIALTDTFSTKPFFEDFVANSERSKTWRGVRQDSGDPVEFIGLAKEAFLKVGADPKSKLIVFSDGLDVPTCLKLKKASDAAGVGCSFGIGTNLTNDFRQVSSPAIAAIEGGVGPIRTEGKKSKALNMVIKLYQIDSKFCIKISDDLTKNTGDAEEVKHAKEVFNLVE